MPERQAQALALAHGLARGRGGPNPIPARIEHGGWHAIAVQALWIIDHPDDYPPPPPRPSEIIMGRLTRHADAST